MYYGDYYRGDYYRGDPGIFGSIWGGIKKVAGVGLDVAAAVNPAVGITRRAVTGIFGGRQPTPTRMVPPPPPIMTGGKVPVGMPEVMAGAVPAAPVYDKMGQLIGYRKKRRSMNYGNVKALRRADRRMSGFVKTARSALKHTNYKVVSKSAGSRGGSRGVITRREASRALSR